MTVLASINSTITILKLSTPSFITSLIYSLFIGLVLLCFILHLLSQRTKSQVSSSSNSYFLQFQRQYFLAYFLVLFSDWLQGPYIYKLYSHYGFVESQIAILYVVGFGSSVLFGTVTGALADRFGRKKMCMSFCLLNSLCCFAKLSPNYYILMLGRIFGGISTSLLFSTFEAWYVHEHTQVYDFPVEWMSITFSKAMFWNGVLAINAGVVANFTSEWMNFGPVSPFIVAMPFLLISGLIIKRSWRENYGNRGISSKKACMEGLRVIVLNSKILLLCIVQSFFESVMYLFVFLWTPVLDSAKPPLGMVFSVFMICIMIGSLVYQLLISRQYSSQGVLAVAVGLSLFSVGICVISTDPKNPNIVMSLCAFLLLEFSVGLYFPSISYVKSQIIPESYRANIMNWFRVPLNIMTCMALLWLHTENSSYGNQYIFGLCSVMMFLATLAMTALHKKLSFEPGVLSIQL